MTRDLRDHWETLRDRIAGSPNLCLLCDFDGTLVELEASPDLPRLGAAPRALLERLAAQRRVTLGIVSGRALADLIPRVGLARIWYVGSHGFETMDPRGSEQRHFSPVDAQYVARVRDELERGLHGIPGVLLEPKGPVLALHYRQADESRIGEIERVFDAVMDGHRGRLRATRGRRVLEARIRGGPDKGRAVRHIRYEQPAGTLMLYFGDDETDRDAFAELRGKGVSIEVGGDGLSPADFTLPDPTAVMECLERIGEEVTKNQ